MLKTWIVTLVALFLAVPAYAQVPLTQIVSRENAAFDGRSAVMTVGRLEPIDYAAVQSCFKSAGFRNRAALCTRNGLTQTENRRRFETPHIAEMIDPVLNGLRTIAGRV